MNNNENIKDICKEYGIINYKINPDGSIDVDGNVDLTSNSLEKIPLKFNKISGWFYCYENNLTSLEGCPKEVGSSFGCSDNKLINLIGSPTYVGNDFYCSINELTSLEGCPNYIGGEFMCYNNPFLPTYISSNPYAELLRLNRERKINTLLNDN
jgi:hypothetical protein